jgi:hypothetical protein
MRVIPTRVHGVIDYLTAVLLILSPWLFGFADGSAAQWVPLIVGVAILGLALMTDFEMGLAPVVPMSVHLAMDVGAGVLLAASPWLFGFAGRVWLPHLLVGAMEVLVALFTVTVPARGPASRRA